MSITCIIPARNESTRISYVLSRLRDLPLINEVIVVDDGSDDDTALVVRELPFVRLISHPKNLGKAAALRTAVSQASGDTILMLDADLSHFRGKDLAAALGRYLSTPGLDMLILVSGYTPWYFRLLNADRLITGQRVVRREILSSVLKEPVDSYQLEIALTEHCLSRHLFIACTGFSYHHTYKTAKIGLVDGLLAELNMILSMFKRVPLTRYLYLILTYHPPELP